MTDTMEHGTEHDSGFGVEHDGDAADGHDSGFDAESEGDARDDNAEGSDGEAKAASPRAPKKTREPKAEQREDINVTNPLHDFAPSGNDELDVEAMEAREDRARHAQRYAERLEAHNANAAERAAIAKRMKRDRDRLAVLVDEGKVLARRLVGAKTQFDAAVDAVERMDRETVRSPKAGES